METSFMSDLPPTFSFTHHYETSDNYLHVVWFGSDLTEQEKKQVIKENEEMMSQRGKGIHSTITLGDKTKC
jgi:hypothetical protein